MELSLAKLKALYFHELHKFEKVKYPYCQTSVLSLKTWSWLCFTLSQQQEEQEKEQEEQEEQEPPTKYLSCYWPDFDQTLNVGFWERLEQIPTVHISSYWPDLNEALDSWEHREQILTVQAIFVLATFVYIKNISAVTNTI